MNEISGSDIQERWIDSFMTPLDQAYLSYQSGWLPGQEPGEVWNHPRTNIWGPNSTRKRIKADMVKNDEVQ